MDGRLHYAPLPHGVTLDPLTANVLSRVPPQIQEQLRPFARDPLPFAWPALRPEAKLAILAGSGLKTGARTLRNIALAVAASYLKRQPDNEATACLRDALATAEAGDPVSFPMFTDFTAKERAVFDLIGFANAMKSANYGTRVAGYIDALVSMDGTAVGDVTAALKPYTFSRVRNAVNTTMPALSISLVEYLPEEVRTKLMALGDIAEGMLSLTDAEAVSVILSRPVIDLDRQRFTETGIAAFSAAVIVFPFPETQELAAMSVQTLSTSDALSIMMRARSRPYDPASSTVEEDLRELTDLDHVTAVLSAVTSKSAIGEDVRGTIETALSACTSTRGKDFAARFQRALRASYPTDVIASAFLPHNVGVNTEAVDVERVQQFLSKNALGALASSFSHHHDLDKAFANMPVRGYLEILRWPPFAPTAAALPGAPSTRLRKLCVRVLVRVNSAVLNEVMVAPTGTSTSDLVEYLLETPMTTEFRASDFLSKDPDAREFARKLTELANTARREPEITDYFILSFGEILNSPYGAAAVPALRKLADALMPVSTCTSAITSQILAASGT